MDQYVSCVCPQKTSAWNLLGPSMKTFASHIPMKSQPDLTCRQASAKAIVQLMSGTVQFRLNCLLPSTHQKLQVSCIKIFSGFPLKMGSLFSKSSMIPI